MFKAIIAAMLLNGEMTTVELADAVLREAGE